jgi:hypothetical protein
MREIGVLKDQLCKENLALREEIDVNRMFEEIAGSPSFEYCPVPSGKLTELSPPTFCTFAREFSAFTAKGCSMAASDPGDRFGRALERPHGPVLPAVASKTHGPAGPAVAGDGQQSVVT